MSEGNVILAHGVWMSGPEMLFVKFRLEREHGFDGHLFSYPSMTASLDENAELLADYIRDRSFSDAHIVAHSLGGVVALRTLSLYPELTSGRVVCMGSPLTGSRAADHLNQHDWGNTILGNTLTEGVIDESAIEWATGVTEQRDVGVIAGTLGIGLGKLVTKFDGENDGTVAVSETLLPGVRDHIRINVSHTGLVLSRTAADQAAAFLKRGAFLRE